MSLELQVAWDRPSTVGVGSHWLHVRISQTRSASARRAVAILLDTSSSMVGRRLETAREAVSGLVRTLTATQPVSIWGFSSTIEPVYRGVGGRDVSVALSALEASGKTCLDVGLAAAGHWLLEHGGGELLILTDGDPTTAEGRRAPTAPLVHQVRELAGQGVRCSTVGIGDAERYDAGFLREIADASGGSCVGSTSTAGIVNALDGLLQIHVSESTLMTLTFESEELQVREAWRVVPRVQPLELDSRTLSLRGGSVVEVLVLYDYRAPLGAALGSRDVGALSCVCEMQSVRKQLSLMHVVPTSSNRFALDLNVDQLRARVELARAAAERSQCADPEDQLRLTRRLEDLAVEAGDPRATARIGEELRALASGQTLSARERVSTLDILRRNNDG